MARRQRQMCIRDSVVAKRLVDLTHLLGDLATTSRDFH